MAVIPSHSSSPSNMKQEASSRVSLFSRKSRQHHSGDWVDYTTSFGSDSAPPETHRLLVTLAREQSVAARFHF